MQALYNDRESRPVSWQRRRQPGRQPGSSRVGYADAIRHGRQLTVNTFWSGITAGCGPAGPLIFCTCAGIRDPASPRPACQRQWRWLAPAAARAVTAWIAEIAAFLAGHAIITVAGEIDIFTVTRLRDQLHTLAGDGRPLIADLDRVTFLGAAGLGTLAGAARRASLHVVCARPQTRQLLQLTGLDRTLRLARTLADALQALPAAPDPATRPPELVPAPPGGDQDDVD